MPLKLSDAGLAVATAVAGRLPLRLRGAFAGIGCCVCRSRRRRPAPDAVATAGQVVRIEAAARFAGPRRGIAPMALPRRRWRRRVRRYGCLTARDEKSG